MMRKNDSNKKNNKERKMSRKGRRILVTVLSAAVLFSTVHSLALPAISLTKDKESDVIQGTEESASLTSDTSVTETTGTQTTQSSGTDTTAMQDDTEITATVYTDSTYAEKKEDEQTTIRIKGSLPVNSETGEVEVEAKAYPTTADSSRFAEGTSTVLGYDVTLFYTEQYRQEGQTLQDAVYEPSEKVDVTISSSKLSSDQLEDDEFYAVYYVPDDTNETPVLVAAESAGVQQQAAAAASGDDSADAKKFREGKEKADALIAENNTQSSDEVSQAMSENPSELQSAVSEKVSQTAQDKYNTYISEKNEGKTPSDLNLGAAAAMTSSEIEEAGQSTAADETQSSDSSENSESTFTPIKGSADEDLQVQTDENNVTEVTFEAEHFSNYQIATVTAPEAGTRDISDKVHISSISFPESADLYSWNDLQIDIATSVQWFEDTYQAGDYFDVVLPKTIDFSKITTNNFTFAGTYITATGEIWLNGNLPMLRIQLTNVDTTKLQNDGVKTTVDVDTIENGVVVKVSKTLLFAANKAFFTIKAHLPFDLEQVEADADGEVNPVSAQIDGYADSGQTTYVTIKGTKRSANEVLQREATVESTYYYINSEVTPETKQDAEAFLNNENKENVYDFYLNQGYGLKITWTTTASETEPSIVAGDYFIIQLPDIEGANYGFYDGNDTLRLTTTINAEEVAVADCILDKDKKQITVRFTDNIEESQDVREAFGSFFVEAKYSTLNKSHESGNSNYQSDFYSTSLPYIYKEGQVQEDNAYFNVYQSSSNNFARTSSYPLYDLSDYTTSAEKDATGNDLWLSTMVLVKSGTDVTNTELPWRADGSGKAGPDDYVVVYCANMTKSAEYPADITGSVTYTKNTLDNNKTVTENKERIRYIISNSYPFISEEAMLNNLGLSDLVGKVDSDELTAATQLAIWWYTNNDVFVPENGEHYTTSYNGKEIPEVHYSTQIAKGEGNTSASKPALLNDNKLLDTEQSSLETYTLNTNERESRMKKFLSKVLVASTAATMMLGMAAPAFAATGDLQGVADKTVSVEGLTEGDKAAFFQLVYFDANKEAHLTAGMENVKVQEDANGNYDATAEKKTITIDQLKTISAYEAGKIAEQFTGDPVIPVQTASAEGKVELNIAYTADDNNVETSVAGESTATQYTAGLYYVRLTPTSAKVLYNPVFVSSDFYEGGNVWKVTTDIAYGSEATAKKSEVKVDKKAGTKAAEDADANTSYEDQYDNEKGDTVYFEIDTTIPAYTEGYSKREFVITDSVDAGLV